MKEYINIGINIETFILLWVIGVGIIGLILFLRLDWKKYGMLFLLSAFVGNTLCYLFVKLGFYSFPYRLFPKLSTIPITEVTLTFPLFVLVGVRYSPKAWVWKIPFYWTIIHIGMIFETLLLTETLIIQYNFKWDFWDSYTWWWIYFLVFEWVGGIVIPDDLRKPLGIHHLRYGKLGWAFIHFILILTIFLGGYYLGSLK